MSAGTIVAGAVFLNMIFVRLSHAAGHPLIMDSVFTAVAAAACGPVAGTAAGLLSTLAVHTASACPVCRTALFAMNGLVGLIAGFALPWNRELTPGRIVLALALVVLAGTTGTALLMNDVMTMDGAGGIALIRTTYRVLGVEPPWPEFFYLFPLNIADKMLTVGASRLPLTHHRRPRATP
ncbi:MAG: hypothetical protein ACOC2D_19740, partial [Spirochaetota bacterium]